MPEPLVSVIMTVFNREDFISEAIKSVLASSYKNFELIIVDDRSVDKSFEIASGYAAKEPRIKLYLNECNLGDYANRNKASTYATGKYIKYLDSDDTIYPEGLSYCISQMEKYPESSFGISMLDGNESDDSVLMSSEAIIRKQFFVSDHLLAGPTGMIIKRSFFENSGRFNPSFRMASDFHFNIKIACETPVVLLKKRFFFYRIHEAQELNNPSGYMVYGYLAKKDILQNLPLPLSANEIFTLKKKLFKDHAFTLIKHFIRNRKLKFIQSVMSETKFTIGHILKYALS